MSRSARGNNRHLFLQNVIALVWDFDKTLIPGYMQEPLFARYGVDAQTFWSEVNALPAEYRKRGVELVSTEVLYLNHILDYTRRGIFQGLSNTLLRELGRELTFYPGLPDFFDRLRERVQAREEFSNHEIRVEHYVISTGLRQMILGSAINPFVDGVWGCELLESRDGASPVVEQLGYVLDNTSKTRALFEINKGSNKHGEIDVNALIADEDRRIPFQNMIYIADGPSDVPVFSLLNRNGGSTFAVYSRGSESQFAQVNRLQQQGRVESFGEADFRDGSQTCMWLTATTEAIARRIVADRERALGEKVGSPPRHLAD